MAGMNISRRWFIIGSSAAVAAAKTSLAELFPAAPALFAPLDVAERRGVRNVSGVTISNGAVGPTRYLFTRNGNDDQPILAYALGSGDSLLWKAVPREEIYLPGNDTLRIVADPDPGNEAAMDVVWDTANGVTMCTRYTFRSGVVTPIYSVARDRYYGVARELQ